MADQSQLTPAQLAALDFMIAHKKEAVDSGLQSFINDILNVVQKVVPVVVQVTPIVAAAVLAAAAADKTSHSADAATALDQLNNVSLDQLIAIRKQSGAQ